MTKCADTEALLEQEHRGHTTLEWTLNPPEIARCYEVKAPPVEERIAAMRRCAEAGYPIRASIMPMIPHGDWENSYLDFVRELLGHVALQRLTLGGVSMDSRTRLLLEGRMGKNNPISRNLSRKHAKKEDTFYYSYELCRGVFGKIRTLAERLQPGLMVDVAIP